MARMNIEQVFEEEIARADEKRYYEKWNEAMTLMDEMRDAQDIQADNIIDALGLRGSYPNRVIRALIQYTDFGRDRFRNDVNLAVDALKGKEAADRIATAVNNLRSTK